MLSQQNIGHYFQTVFCKFFLNTSQGFRILSMLENLGKKFHKKANVVVFTFACVSD